MTYPDQPMTPTVKQRSESPTYWNTTAGLTKREYFAAMALQGLCANYLREGITGWGVDTYTNEAVSLADSLIKALNK